MGKNGHNIITYTIGNKTFTTSALVVTVIATDYGGTGLISTVVSVNTYGLCYMVFMIGSNVMEYLSRIVVSYRVDIFMKDHVDAKSPISMADIIGQIYGKITRIITAIVTVCGHCPCNCTGFRVHQDFANFYK